MDGKLEVALAYLDQRIMRARLRLEGLKQQRKDLILAASENDRTTEEEEG